MRNASPMLLLACLLSLSGCAATPRQSLPLPEPDRKALEPLPPAGWFLEQWEKIRCKGQTSDPTCARS